MEKEPIFITAIKYGAIWLAAWGLLSNIHITITHKTPKNEDLCVAVELFSPGKVKVEHSGNQDVSVSGYLY